MTEDEFWTIERGFWLEGRTHYQAHWSADAIAAFPKPTGVMAGDGFVDGLPDTGSWTGVEMTERAFSRPAPNVAVLAYLGTGRSPTRSYACVCSSVYVDRDGWRMVQHAQVPVAE